MAKSSYVKTTWLALAATLASGAVAVLLLSLELGGFGTALGVLAGAFAAGFAGLAAAGGLVLSRVRRGERGAADLYLASNAPRSESALGLRERSVRPGVLRRWAARVTLGHDFLVGDDVEVRSLAEIEATLDDTGRMNGLPFQAEMARYCGTRGRIFRSVDKIYDYGRTRLMRRLDGCVLLTELRCDGSAHGFCQARCYMIWNVAWLRRPKEPRAQVAPGHRGRIAPADGIDELADGTRRSRFHCQYTELHAASRPMGALEIGKELRPFIAGNVTFLTWIVGLGTRYFNAVQALRQGTAFPAMAPPTAPPPSGADSSLQAGDRVVVRSNTEISGTLNARNKHRGLWFDRDQLKYCGTEQRVLARVDQIIDDVHGQMLRMKTPCILLDGVDYSGESLSFSAQHDLFFWREAWLEKIDSSDSAQTRGTKPPTASPQSSQSPHGPALDAGVPGTSSGLPAAESGGSAKA
jgi:hypothetical protein